MNKKEGPVKILLIDDDQGDIEFTRDILSESKINLSITSVESGEEALRYLQKQGPFVDSETPDLILLDLNMPKMNGIETLQAIKREHKLKKLPVIILTTSEDDDDIARTYLLGASSFITKPVDCEQFEQAIKSIHNIWFTVFKFPST